MGLKKSIEHELHVPVRLRLGGPGSLDIYADGVKIYSKKQTGRLPSVEEAINLLRSRNAV